MRAFRSVGGNPPFIARGEGSHFFDADGNDYIDYVGSWGPLMLGHRHPAILAALEEALAIGTSFGAPTEQEIELAEAIRDAVPSIEMVRLVNSGTEATMSRHPGGARLHRPRPDREVRRLLSRPCGFAAGEGRLRHRDARHAGHPRRARRLLPAPRSRCRSTPDAVEAGIQRARRPDRVGDCRAGGRQHGLRAARDRLPGRRSATSRRGTARC